MDVTSSPGGSNPGGLRQQGNKPVPRKPTLEAILDRATLLVLPQKYHDNAHVLRVRSCVAIGLLVLGAAAAAAALVWASRAMPALPPLLIALWLAAEAWFYAFVHLPRWGRWSSGCVHTCMHTLRPHARPPP